MFENILLIIFIRRKILKKLLFISPNSIKSFVQNRLSIIDHDHYPTICLSHTSKIENSFSNVSDLKRKKANRIFT